MERRLARTAVVMSGPVISGHLVDVLGVLKIDWDLHRRRARPPFLGAAPSGANGRPDVGSVAHGPDVGDDDLQQLGLTLVLVKEAAPLTEELCWHLAGDE